MITFYAYGTKYTCYLDIAQYADENGGIAVIATERDGSVYGKLTVFVEGVELGEDEACIDTNNWPELPDIIKQYNLGEDTGRVAKCNYCTYPIYKMNPMVISLHER